MAKYQYKAINSSGKEVSGELEAESPDNANSVLSSRGLIPIKVAKATGSSASSSELTFADRFTKIKPQEIILFTKQFRTMLKSGVSIMRLLEIMENQTENPKLRKIVSIMAKDITEGYSLNGAFQKHEQIFSPLYCNMVKAGEASGSLPEVLERLTYIIEHEHKVKSDIKAALRYPMIVCIALAGAFVSLIQFVLPKFAGIFSKSGMALPMPTRVCLLLNRIISDYWMIVLGILILTIVILSRYFKTEQGQFVRDSTLMSIPIIGPLLEKSAMSRFASIFSILQASGVGIMDSMKILTGTIGNAAIVRQFKRISEQLSEGRGISGPLSKAKYFPPMVTNMIAIGEESGNLDEMLKEVAVHYDTEVEYAVEKLSAAIGPLLTVGLAAVIGFFAFAVYLPMWNMMQIVN
ncbi:MAG: type II secretion system F family protein [Proteobacteria bacterium]|nr:type II secretion system F family protein [Pseudomonadota bacterium]